MTSPRLTYSPFTVLPAATAASGQAPAAPLPPFASPPADADRSDQLARLLGAALGAVAGHKLVDRFWGAPQPRPSFAENLPPRLPLLAAFPAVPHAGPWHLESAQASLQHSLAHLGSGQKMALQIAFSLASAHTGSLAAQGLKRRLCGPRGPGRAAHP